MAAFSFVIVACATACMATSSFFSNLGGGGGGGGGGAGDDGSWPSRKKIPPNTHCIDANPIFSDEDDNNSEEENKNSGGSAPCSMWPSWLRWRPELLPDFQFALFSYVCEICSQRFPTNHALCRHMSSHLPPAAWCPRAEREMHSNILIEYMMTLLGSESMYMSIPCSFLARGDLPRPPHLRYQCSACMREFNTKQALGGHRASHKNRPGCFAKEKLGLVPVHNARRKRAVHEERPNIADLPMLESLLIRQRSANWADGTSSSSANSRAVTATLTGAAAPAGEPSIAMEGRGGGRRRIMMDFDLNLPAEFYNPDNENADGGGEL